eukprot:1143456-Pelagomonas_calceolata.AAC.14
MHARASVWWVHASEAGHTAALCLLGASMRLAEVHACTGFCMVGACDQYEVRAGPANQELKRKLPLAATCTCVALKAQWLKVGLQHTATTKGFFARRQASLESSNCNAGLCDRKT